MSALGQKRSFIPGSPNVRFAPKADIGALGAEQQNGWALRRGQRGFLKRNVIRSLSPIASYLTC